MGIPVAVLTISFSVMVGAITAYLILRMTIPTDYDLTVDVHMNGEYKCITDEVSLRRWPDAREAILDLRLPLVKIKTQWQDVPEEGWLACSKRVMEGYNVLIATQYNWHVIWLKEDEVEFTERR